MTTAASRPDPAAATDRTWTVVVNMPVHTRGKVAGQPVGWQSLNNLPASRIESIRWGQAKKAWRVAAYSAIERARVPQHLGRIEVGIELRFTETREDRNAENFEHTIKPVIDALTRLKSYTRKVTTTVKGRAVTKDQLVIELGRDVVDGDDERYIVRSGPVSIGDPLGRKSPVRGQVVLTIRQIPTAVKGGPA